MQKSIYNIAHILPWQTVGGTELATLRIAKGIDGAEFRSIAFHLPDAGPIQELFESEGFQTAQYRTFGLSFRNPALAAKITFDMARALRRHRVDLVHCADVLAAYYASLAGKLAGIPVLCHVRNRFASLTRRECQLLYPVNHFAFVSQDTWSHFQYKVAPGNGTVVYDGIEARGQSHSDIDRASLRREFGIPDGAAVIGMVARVAPQKDYPTLIKAARRVVRAHPNVRFLIVGEYSGTPAYREHYSEIKRMLADAGVGEYFVFTDFQSDVPKFLDLMDIFVLSTHCEGLPLVILEAMAHGKPVIATDVDGIPEIVSHNKTGLLYAHQDEEALYGHLIALLSDREFSNRLGAAGKHTVESKWTHERFARDVKNLYRRLLGAEHKTGS